MVDKILLNNMVLMNKTKIKQGRIQVINKFVHKVRKLSLQLQRHTQNSKYKESLAKTKESIEYLKRIKCIDVVKSVLLLEKKPLAIMTNGLSGPDEMAIALLALNKVIQEVIIMLKDKLHLSAGDNRWRKELTAVSKRTIKQAKKKEKVKDRESIKQRKLLDRKREEWVKENLSNDREKNHQVDHSHVEDKIYPKKLASTEQQNSEEEGETEHMDMDSKPKSVDVRKKGNEFTSEIRYAVDSFFITDSGEDYLTSVILEDPIENVEDENRTTTSTVKFSNESKELKTYSSKFEEKPLKRTKPKLEYAQKKRGDDSIQQDEHLHPSWAAKQKLKPTIKVFQGQKIIFE